MEEDEHLDACIVCNRCGYTTNRISNIKTHLKRKTQCNDDNNCGISCEDLLKEFEKDTSSFEYECKSCDIKFKTPQGLNYHKRNACKDKDKEKDKDKDKENERIKELESDVKILKEKNKLEKTRIKKLELEITRLKTIISYLEDKYENKTTNNYTYKKYELPSGKIVNVQGYEPFALNNLLKNYKEDEIFVGAGLMPEIWYHDDDNGKYHRYFPDIYIPKDNLIIEVKSTFTLLKNKRKVHITKNACIALGFNFELQIYNDRGKMLNKLIEEEEED